MAHTFQCHVYGLFWQINKVLAVCQIAVDLLSQVALPRSIVIQHVEALMILGDLGQAELVFNTLSNKESDDALLLQAKLLLHNNKVSNGARATGQVLEWCS